MPKLNEYLTIKEAAEYLGVSQNTLRNWGRDVKFKERRHPVNGYRLFSKADLDALLEQVEKVESKKRRRPRAK